MPYPIWIRLEYRNDVGRVVGFTGSIQSETALIEVLERYEITRERLRRRGIFAAGDGRSLSKLSLEEIQHEYERLEREESGELVKGNTQTAVRHPSL